MLTTALNTNHPDYVLSLCWHYLTFSIVESNYEEYQASKAVDLVIKAYKSS